jgi:hypothetical protein
MYEQGPPMSDDNDPGYDQPGHFRFHIMSPDLARRWRLQEDAIDEWKARHGIVMGRTHAIISISEMGDGKVWDTVVAVPIEIYDRPGPLDLDHDDVSARYPSILIRWGPDEEFSVEEPAPGVPDRERQCRT